VKSTSEKARSPAATASAANTALPAAKPAAAAAANDVAPDRLRAPEHARSTAVPAMALATAWPGEESPNNNWDAKVAIEKKKKPALHAYSSPVCAAIPWETNQLCATAGRTTSTVAAAPAAATAAHTSCTRQ
jgi:hypothetical protein